MGQFYRSDGDQRGTDDIVEHNITTTTSSSSSSSYPNHRVIVRTTQTDQTDPTTTTSTADAQDPLTHSSATEATSATARTILLHDRNAHGADERRPADVPEGHKPPASTAVDAVTVAVREEELGEEEAVDEEEVAFRAALKARGLEMVEQEGDGNCLFRAVSLQVYGDSEVHMDVRRRCLDFMAKDEAHFSEFVVDEPFMQYILRKRQNGVHGNNPEIQAISELYNRPVELFVPTNGATPINIFQAAYKTCDAPLRLSYHDGNHYNAVTDPLCPTAGLGLGLPGLEPGLADRMQMQKAVDESEDLHADRFAKESHEMEVQKAIVESKRDSGKGFEMYYKQKAALMVSDMEATDFELEQAALVDSLKTSCHYNNNNDAGQKQPWNHGGQHKPQQRSQNRRRHQSSSASSTRFPETSSTSATLRSRPHSSPESPLVASLPAASAASSRDDADIPAHLLQGGHHGGGDDEYPQTVQELVMNGFTLERVVKAYDLIGDNFDDLLAFLMSSGNGNGS